MLRRAEYSLVPQRADELATAIFASVAAFEAERKETGPFRDNHDALRAIYLLASCADPPVGQIKSKLYSLSGPARSQLKRRAGRLWPIIFGAPYTEAALTEWIRNADRQELLDRLRTLLSEGAIIITGRGRPSGRRSKRRLEPVIMGVVRGAGRAASISHSGRPRSQPADNLVMYLAIDWLVVTGQSPAAGRSGAKPFGELVHHVFDWLNLPGADQALRRYWTAVAREAARARQG